MDLFILFDGSEVLPNHLSNETRAPGCGCLGYIGDYTTQLFGDYNATL